VLSVIFSVFIWKELFKPFKFRSSDYGKYSLPKEEENCAGCIAIVADRISTEDKAHRPRIRTGGLASQNPTADFVL
jgi:hypothetical protein